MVAPNDSTPSTHASQEATKLATALAAQLRLAAIVDIGSLYGDSLGNVAAPAIEASRYAKDLALLAEAERTVRAAGIPVESVVREDFAGSPGDQRTL